MSFWEDSSPLVKIALVVGVLGFIYLGADFALGLFLFPGDCSYETEDGTSMDGCPDGSTCNDDGECVQMERGI
jgi:hypothetical protein